MKPTKRRNSGKRATRPAGGPTIDPTPEVHPSPEALPVPAATESGPLPVGATATDASRAARAPRLLWGVDADAVATLCSLRLELPSRLFRPVYPNGASFTSHDAIADAALVHRLTGLTPDIGLELPADPIGDPAELVAHATDAGVRIGSVHPDVSARPGRPLPLCHPDPDRAERARMLLRRAAGTAVRLGARRFVLRWRDGAPYPGKAETERRRQQLIEVLRGLRRELPGEMALVVEHVVVDPHPIRRSGPDWQAACALAVGAGPGTRVLLDLAGGDPGFDSDADLSITTLRAADRLAGIVLGASPWSDQRFALFLAMIDAVEGGILVRGRRCPVPFLLDLPEGRSGGVEATLRAVHAIQDAAAKAMLLDRAAWRAAQSAGDRVAASEVLLAAYESDASPLLTAVRAALGVPSDALASYRELCRNTHRAVERQRSVLRAALRSGALNASLVPAETLLGAGLAGEGSRSAGRFDAGIDNGPDGGSGSRLIAGGRWPGRIRGLRGVG